MFFYKLLFTVSPFLFCQTSGITDYENCGYFPGLFPSASTEYSVDVPRLLAGANGTHFLGFGIHSMAHVHSYTDGACRNVRLQAENRCVAILSTTNVLDDLLDIRGLIQSFFTLSITSTPVTSTLSTDSSTHEIHSSLSDNARTRFRDWMSSVLPNYGNVSQTSLVTSFSSANERFVVYSRETELFPTPVLPYSSRWVSRRRTGQINLSSPARYCTSTTVGQSPDTECPIECSTAVHLHLVSKLKDLLKKIKKIIQEYRRSLTKFCRLIGNGRFRSTRVRDSDAQTLPVTVRVRRMPSYQRDCVSHAARRNLVRRIRRSRSVLRVAERVTLDMNSDSPAAFNFLYCIKILMESVDTMEYAFQSIPSGENEHEFTTWTTMINANLNLMVETENKAGRELKKIQLSLRLVKLIQ